MNNLAANLVEAARRCGERTAITWSSTFEPRGMPEEGVVALIESIYRMFIANLKKTLGS